MELFWTLQLLASSAMVLPAGWNEPAAYSGEFLSSHEWKNGDQILREVRFVDDRPDLQASYRLLKSGLLGAGCESQEIVQSTEHVLIQFECLSQNKSGHHELFLERGSLKLRSLELPQASLSAQSVASTQELFGKLTHHPRVQLKLSRRLVDEKTKSFSDVDVESCRWASSQFIDNVKTAVSQRPTTCRFQDTENNSEYSCEAQKQGESSITYRFFWNEEACQKVAQEKGLSVQAGLRSAATH
jgi:hypothetical protein